jgi:UDP-GlcNAc:undecaprenyl-phosphate GlcNAc-1-phosphate transferase
VPFLDTTFVVLKRLKYRRPVYEADQEHLHHRMARIGFSVRRTLLFFYGWTLMLAGLALALRFIPYSYDDAAGHGHLRFGWAILVVVLGLIVAAASVYLVYVLEILKFNRGGGRSAESPTLKAEGSNAREPDAGEGDAREGEAGEGDAHEGESVAAQAGGVGEPSAQEQVAGHAAATPGRDPPAR